MMRVVRIDFNKKTVKLKYLWTETEKERQAHILRSARKIKKNVQDFFSSEEKQLNQLRRLKSVNPNITIREIMSSLHIGSKRASELSKILSDEELILTPKELKLDQIREALEDYPNMSIRELSNHLGMCRKTVSSYIKKYIK